MKKHPPCQASHIPSSTHGNLAVDEHTGRHYLSAAATYRERSADKGAEGAGRPSIGSTQWNASGLPRASVK